MTTIKLNNNINFKTMNDIKTPIELDPIQGHIVLLCKNWYKMPKRKSFFEALRMIWAIRCGYDYKLTSYDTDSYIANDMWEVINTCAPERLTVYMDNFHREIGNTRFKPKDMTAIQAIIWEYKNIISNLTICNKVGEEWIPIIKLPKPNNRVFKRILRGNGKYNDYYTITNIKKK